MARRLRRHRNFSEEEKKKIAKEMIKGYQKMADLNRELAEDGLKSENTEKKQISKSEQLDDETA